MPVPLTPVDTEPLVRLADHIAGRVCRKALLSSQEREDLRQDLLLNRMRCLLPTRPDA